MSKRKEAERGRRGACAPCGEIMKRIIILFFALLVSAVTGAAAEQEYCSIREVREQAEKLFNGSKEIEIEAKDGSCAVSIEIPDVENVPVIRIARPRQDDGPEAPENGIVREPPEGYQGVNWRVSVNREELYGQIRNTARIILPGPDAFADGSPLTMTEAIDFTDRVLEHLADRGWEYRLSSWRAYSQPYKAKGSQAGPVPDTDHPLDGHGYYRLEYDQVLHGIPYCGSVFFSTTTQYDRRTALIAGTCSFSVFSPDCYQYTLFAAAENGVLDEDIPLCPLEKVIRELKLFCRNQENNHLRLRFVYKAWDDPENREGDQILLPAWVLESDWNSAENVNEIVCVNAQTGKSINADSKDRNRSNAVWLGW